MKQIRVILLFLLLCTSCKTQISTFDYGIPEEMEVPTLPLSLHDTSNGLLYSELYSKVEYIPLETTERSLVGGVRKLEIANNGDLIILDSSKRSVLRFDRKGKFVCHIGQRGSGHGEYQMANDIVYDKYNNNIILLDMGSCKLNTYDMNGKVLSSVKLDFMPAAVCILDKDYLCVYMNHYEMLSGNSTGHNIKVLNHEGCVVSEFLEYDATMNLFQPNSEDVFFSDGAKTCFKQPYSSLIYTIDDVNYGTPSITPSYYIDFGEKKIPEEWYRLEFQEMAKNMSEVDGIIYLSSAHTEKDRLFLNIARNSRPCLYIMNLKDRSRDKYGFYSVNDMFGFASSIILMKLHDNKCYFVNSPSMFLRYKDKIDRDDVKFFTVNKDFNSIEYFPTQKEKDLINSIHDGDNPIIQVCTLKE